MANGQLGAQAGQVGEVLQGLFKYIGQSTEGIRSDIGQASEAQNPLNILGDLLASAGLQASENELRESAAGTTQRLEQQGMEAPDPLSEATLKEVLKIRKEQVREAAEQGTPLEGILQQAEAMKTPTGQPNPGQGLAPQPQGAQGTQQGQAGQAPTPGQQPSQPEQQKVNLLKLMANTFLDTMAEGGKQGRAQRKANIELTKAQKRQIEGKPAAEQQKRQSQFFSNILQPKPLGGESATQANLSQALTTDITQLQDILQLDSNALEQLALPGNKLGQRVRDITSRLKANLVALRGGKSLTANEEKIINSLIPKRGFSAKLQDKTSVNFMLDSVKNDSERQLNLLQPSRQLREVTRNLLENFSQEEVFSALQRRGLIAQ